MILFSEKNEINLNELIFDGGEEFELVFTVTPKNLKKIHRLAKNNNQNLTWKNQSGDIWFATKNEDFLFNNKTLWLI